MNLFKAFVWFNFFVIGVGLILTLCVSMFDDLSRVNGRKSGRHE